MIREETITGLKKCSPEQRAPYGRCVLVMRRWPRGLSWRDIDCWIPSAGPSEELLAAWNAHLLRWPAFVAQYRREQLQQCAYVVKTRGEGWTQSLTATGRAIDYLQELAQRETVTVLCWERDEHCH